MSVLSPITEFNVFQSIAQITRPRLVGPFLLSTQLALQLPRDNVSRPKQTLWCKASSWDADYIIEVLPCIPMDFSIISGRIAYIRFWFVFHNSSSCNGAPKLKIKHKAFLAIITVPFALGIATLFPGTLTQCNEQTSDVWFSRACTKNAV